MARKVKLCLLLIGLLAFSSLTAACGDKTKPEDTKITVAPVQEEQPAPEDLAVLSGVVDKVQVVLYFTNEQGQLVAEKRDVPKVDGIARMAMHELAKGPQAGSGLLSTLPPGAQLKDISIKDGLCIVDFSTELKENHAGGSGEELVTVYSIINTLTQFSTVERVQILVNGQIVETLAGHISLHQPLERNDSIITSANP